MDDLDLIPFASRDYFIVLAVVAFGRAMDFLSTWIATPNLRLEGNPIAKWLGWKWGMLLNVAMCLGFALSFLTAIVVTTMSLLVAARNFQGAWTMRVMGESAYQAFMSDVLAQRGRGGYLLTLYAQALLTGLVGAALVAFSGELIVPTGIGMGVVAYAVAVAFYSTLGMWRGR